MNTMQRLLILLFLITVEHCYGEVPKLFREQSFNAADLAEAVNHFVSIGELVTVKELNDLASDQTGDAGRRVDYRIGWVCRILFRPKGKEPLPPPAFGRLDLGNVGLVTSVGQVLKVWPLFPVALSGSTYFVLGDGYELGGRAEDPKKYIAYCQQNGVFLTTPVKVPTRKQAMKDAAALRRSKAWKTIKWQDLKKGESYGSEVHSWSFIQNQAEAIP